MTFSVESVAGSSGISAPSSISVSFTITSANLLMVAVGIGATGGGIYPTSVTFNSVAMTAVANSDSTDSNWVSVRWYRLYNPSVTTANIVVNLSSVILASLHAVSFIDADVNGTPLGAPGTNTTNATNPTVTVADSAAGDIVVSAVASDVGTLDTMTETGTLIAEFEDLAGDDDHSAQYQTATGSNTVCNWTCGTAQPYAASGLAVKPLPVQRMPFLGSFGRRRTRYAI